MAPARKRQAPLRVQACKAAAGSEETVALGFIPADPDDARLTLDGAVVGADGKLDIEAYEDIMECWAGEPSPDNHPDPLHPGVRRGEEIPKGLRMWDDVRAGCTTKDGAGWIAVRTSNGQKKEKWFNIRTSRSWRLAFLFAKLQRSVWEREEERLPRAAAAASTKDAKEMPGASTPSKPVKRARPTGSGQASSPAKTAKVAEGSAAEAGKPSEAAPLPSKLNSMLDRIKAKQALKEGGEVKA